MQDEIKEPMQSDSGTDGEAGRAEHRGTSGHEPNGDRCKYHCKQVISLEKSIAGGPVVGFMKSPEPAVKNVPMQESGSRLDQDKSDCTPQDEIKNLVPTHEITLRRASGSRHQGRCGHSWCSQ
jgi:hypothetical protein